MISLVLSIPPSANRLWKTRVINRPGGAAAMTYLSAEARAYKEEVALRAATAGMRQPLDGRVRVSFSLYPHRPNDWASRMRRLGPLWADGVQCLDLDNCSKALLDALKGVAFGDDKFVHSLVAERCEPDAHGARLHVSIQQL